jgi:SpoIID/LytB domain protein
VDKEGHYFRWSVKYSQKEFRTFFSEKIQENVTNILKIEALSRGESGRINNVYLDYQIFDGTLKTLNITNEYDIRRLLHPSFLYSSCFKIIMENDNIKFMGAGWGHGVGLCQIGALGMALNDYKTEDILLHYFKHTKLKRLY